MKLKGIVMNNYKKIYNSYRFLQITTGIIYLIMAIIAISYTRKTIIHSIQIMGVFSLLKGFFELTNQSEITMRINHKKYTPIIIGVIDTIIGVVFIFNKSLNLNSLITLFAIWFICDLIISFFMLDLAKKINIFYYYLSILINLFGFILVLLLILSEYILNISISSVIGNYFLLFGFTKIIGGIINKNDLNTIK